MALRATAKSRRAGKFIVISHWDICYVEQPR